MKNSEKKIFLTLATTVGISLGTLLLTSPVAANDNSQINNSLIPREPNFFQQGREQFERELQLLIKSSRTNQETVLKVVPDKPNIQQQLSPLEKPQVVPTVPIESEPN
ncbi:hypothetical protein [Anabaena azotica]|uniref:Uncharacterized protein n=1 Tax=Anabaena azotica FACHB-119 TaxID=947527 RepID=A0ABR8DBM5_9NOST|nr:hypothetical protein [Anabaena azotica]MBD2504312.1 hypothetical protein [Anabaena azotica FACHB-119]